MADMEVHKVVDMVVDKIADKVPISSTAPPGKIFNPEEVSNGTKHWGSLLISHPSSFLKTE